MSRRYELGYEPTASAALDHASFLLWQARQAFEELRKEKLSGRSERALDEIVEALDAISTDSRPDHSSWLLCELHEALTENDNDIGVAAAQAELDARDDAKDRHDADAFDRARDR